MIQFQNKNRIAYLGAWTLILSYAELLLPRFLPFFRLGLGNTVILLALNLNFLDFFALIILKSLASCITAGTLLSPFAIISLGQSIGSGLVMFFCSRVISRRLISIYGVSMLGSAISAVIQLLLSSLYLGSGVFSLAGPMMIFSLLSAVITAGLSKMLRIPGKTPPVIITEEKKQNHRKNLLLVLAILAFSVFIMMTKRLPVLIAAALVSFAAQLASKRRIKLLPHLWLWLFVVFSSLLVKNGRVLLTIFVLPVTQGALITGITKSLKLSAVMALSQCAAAIKIDGESLLALTLAYFKQLRESFDDGELRKLFQKS